MKLNNNIQLVILGVIAAGIVGAIVYFETQRVDRNQGGVDQEVVLSEEQQRSNKASRYEQAKEIVAPAGFINTNGESITVQELVGKKVVMIDFWTYSCINCRRTIPYLNAWYEKYKDQGLEIIGVHTPEFAFEQEIENVQGEVDAFGISYPVVLDNDYGTWRNYQNRYWPRKYLIDIDGFIVYDHIGEGAYDETEKKIQELLEERRQVLGMDNEVSSDLVSPEGVEFVDFTNKRSPETYFGSLRNVNFGNGRRSQVGEQELVVPGSPRTDVLYLDGTWDIQEEFAQNTTAGAKIVFPYQAQKVFMVASADEPVNLTILIDGEPVGERAGSDVVDGVVTVQEETLYRLIEDDANEEHLLEIIIEGPGLQAFTFTFG